MVNLKVHSEIWPLAESFSISHFTQIQSRVVVVDLYDGDHVGHGECEPHESDDGLVEVVVTQLQSIRDIPKDSLARSMLATAVANAAARNALDCASWDLEAKQLGVPVWKIAGLNKPKPLVTAYTIGMDTPSKMAKKAMTWRHRKLLKIKLGEPDGDIERVHAVRAAAPDATLIVDVNGGWTPEQLVDDAPRLHALGVRLIEQPLPPGEDETLLDYDGPVPLCADESCCNRSSLRQVVGRYDFINIKLDKTGGLTEALALAREAKSRGLRLMAGCMLGTSLAMAPAFLVAGLCEFVDLDAPLLLADDRTPSIQYDNEKSLIAPPPAELWG